MRHAAGGGPRQAAEPLYHRPLLIDDGDALAGCVAEAAQTFGGIDIVVANVSALAIPNDEANWQKTFEVDMMGTVRLVNAAMPSIEESDHASIVTISSVSWREIDIASGPYGAFKAAIIHYTQGRPTTWQARRSAPTPCRPATRTSRAACGSRSNMATLNCSRWRWA